jgi:biopolymer transport protein ExbB/TolQ
LLFALAIAAERIYYVIFRANINGTAFMAQIQKLIMANNIDRAIKLCNAEPNAALPRVLKAGLTRANRGDTEIENAVEEAVREVFPALTKRTGYLPMLANVATLTGLLGTIQGLILAFEAVAHASAETKQTMLASGISVAMVTTASGLVVAIPTLVLHAIIAGQTTKIMNEIDLYALKTVNLLSARRRGALKEEDAPAS